MSAIRFDKIVNRSVNYGRRIVNRSVNYGRRKVLDIVEVSADDQPPTVIVQDCYPSKSFISCHKHGAVWAKITNPHVLIVFPNTDVIYTIHIYLRYGSPILKAVQ